MGNWWTNWTSGRTGKPLWALVAGSDLDGSKVYVARAFYEGEMIPGKYIPSKQKMYTCWNGEEIMKNKFEVLSAIRVAWVPSSDGEIRLDAVRGGRTITGERLFVGRGNYNGCLTP